MGTKEGAFWHYCTGIIRVGGGVWNGGAGVPHCTPGLVCLPHFIEQLHHFIVDDEHDGHIQADSAQPGNGALVESG